jgi:ubiquitin-like modifier-activating enzyme ATG7
MSQILQFESFHSSVDPDFWYELENRKLTQYKLDNTEKDIYATYTTGGEYAQVSSRIRLGREAFDVQDTLNGLTNFNFLAPGALLNANTMDDFKNYDKKVLLRETAKTIYDSIITGSWLADPTQLIRFLVISFAELKSHVFYYWFAFPVLVPAEPIRTTAIHSLHDVLGDNVENLRVAYDSFRTEHKASERSFFVIGLNTSTGNIHVRSITEYRGEKKQDEKYFFAFSDPSSLDQHPGWPLRNYILAIKESFGSDEALENPIIFLREIPSKRDLSRSFAATIDWHQVPRISTTSFDSLNVVGWEKNDKTNKTAPRSADMGSMMDPMKLAESSVRLNLELMKWRMFQSLDLDMLSKTKCLLVGAGTLGCHVARNLMAWGVFNITLLDRTKVSFSNPVRQPLYEYKDCLNGGRNKAEAAAEHLRLIYPKANVEHYQIDIPMPGHVFEEKHREEVKKNVDLMTRLVSEHDAIFLLTDTRESRWLPTVLATSMKKIVINSALGFESYLVMRHGVPGHDRRLGCYFCNDVVAPVDSTRDRTLDQQCTVTRPGVSAVAGSLAVELLIGILHHPEREHAPASILGRNEQQQSELGFVPHQIRGSMSTFQNALLTGTAYHQCTACSPVVVQEYEKSGFEFLEKVFNRPKILEEITGLDEMHEKTKKLFEEIEELDEEENNADGDDFELI